MEQEIDPAVSRLLDLVEELGGAAQVARSLDKHPQLFYNLRDGKSKFSLTTLTEIARVHPGEVDANFILFGSKTPAKHNDHERVNASTAPVLPASAPVDSSDWKGRYDTLSEKYDALLTQYHKLVEGMLQKRTITL